MPPTDRDWMARAVELSRRGFPAPNPHVGCVIVQDGKIVGEGHHESAGGPHAEAVALDQAGDSAKGSTVYVTLEPCNHHGRTPPCSEALVRHGVAKVLFAVGDPDPVASGGGDRLRGAGIVVESGLLAQEASEANRQFLKAVQNNRPYVTLKCAVTLDGFAARKDGTSKWVTGEGARQDGHRLRAERGSVLVGRGTVQTDDPLLTARIEGVANQPVRVVLDPAGKLTGRDRVFGEEAKTVWLGQGTNQTPWDGTVQGALGVLAQLGIRGVLVEGGPRTHATFLESGLADEVVLYVAPVLFGEGLTWAGGFAGDIRAFGFELTDVTRFGNDVRLTYLGRD